MATESKQEIRSTWLKKYYFKKESEATCLICACNIFGLHGKFYDMENIADQEGWMKLHLLRDHGIGDEDVDISVPKWLQDHYMIKSEKYVAECKYCSEELRYAFDTIDLENHLKSHQDKLTKEHTRISSKSMISSTLKDSDLIGLDESSTEEYH